MRSTNFNNARMKHDLEYYEKMKADSLRIIKSLKHEPNFRVSSMMKYVQEILDSSYTFNYDDTDIDMYILVELCVLSSEHFEGAHPCYHVYLVDAFLADKDYDVEWSELEQHSGHTIYPPTLRVTVWGHKNDELDKKFQTRTILKCPILHKLKPIARDLVHKTQLLEGEVDGQVFLRRESSSINFIKDISNYMVYEPGYYRGLKDERLEFIHSKMKDPVVFVVDEPMTYVQEIRDFFHDHESKSDVRYIMVKLCVLGLERGSDHYWSTSGNSFSGCYYVYLVDNFLADKEYDQYMTKKWYQYPSTLCLTIWSPEDKEIEKKFQARTSVKCPVHLLKEIKGKDGDKERYLQAEVHCQKILNFT